MSDSTVVTEGCLPDFVRRQFQAAGLEEVAAGVVRGDLLAAEEVERLTEVALPLVAKLVSLRPDHEWCAAPGVDPVVCVSHSDVEKAIHTVRATVGELMALTGDERVQAFGDCVCTLHVLSDSPEPSACRIVENVLEQAIPDAERLGVRLLFAGHGVAAEPISEDEAGGAMRRVAATYLQSPAGTEIRAPIGELGIKTAHVALSYGANHLGQAAVDRETAGALRIPTLAELADALRYDNATPA